MNKENLKDELKPFYEKEDCCSWIVELRKDKYQLQQRIDKAIEYIKEKYDYVLGDDTFLDHDELVDRKQILHILEILGEKENEL